MSLTTDLGIAVSGVVHAGFLQVLVWEEMHRQFEGMVQADTQQQLQNQTHSMGF